MASERVLMGLDIGSANIRAVLCSLSKDGNIMVDSICECQSEGVENGVIVNSDKALHAIVSVIQEAELQAGTEAQNVIIGVGGSSIKGIQSQGAVGIKTKGLEITNSDIYRSLELARTFELGQDRMILHTLVQDFSVDGKTVKDPTSFFGHRLDSRALVVTASQSNCLNLKKCVQRSDIPNCRLVLQQLADADVVLNQDQKDMGTILINIGSNITNMIIYQNGSPKYVGGIDLGGVNVTNDIAYIINKPKNIAEQIKCKYGNCYVPSVNPEEKIIIPQVGSLPSIQMPKAELSKIIEPRMAEIFSILKKDLEDKNIDGSFGGGIVLVGGGSLLSGVTELSQEIFRIQSSIGFPEALPGLDRTYIDPRYTTVLGLIKSESKRTNPPKGYKSNSTISSNYKKGLFQKLSNFFKTVV